MTDKKPSTSSPKRGSLEWYEQIETEAQVKAAEQAAAERQAKTRQAAPTK